MGKSQHLMKLSFSMKNYWLWKNKSGKKGGIDEYIFLFFLLWLDPINKDKENATNSVF
jgi:hypothetical protein